jgi:hypothetical protein
MVRYRSGAHNSNGGLHTRAVNPLTRDKLRHCASHPLIEFDPHQTLVKIASATTSGGGAFTDS